MLQGCVMEVCAFSSLGHGSIYAYEHTVEEDDVAHTFGCDCVPHLVPRHHEDTEGVLQELVCRLGINFKHGWFVLRFALRMPNCLQARCDFYFRSSAWA
jgi:hypothetical protein